MLCDEISHMKFMNVRLSHKKNIFKALEILNGLKVSQ